MDTTCVCFSWFRRIIWWKFIFTDLSVVYQYLFIWSDTHYSIHTVCLSKTSVDLYINDAERSSWSVIMKSYKNNFHTTGLAMQSCFLNFCHIQTAAPKTIMADEMHCYGAHDNAVKCILGDIQLSYCSYKPLLNEEHRFFSTHASNNHASLSSSIPLHRASKWTNIIHSFTPIASTHHSPALSSWSWCLTMKGIHGATHGFYIWKRACHLIGIPPVYQGGEAGRRCRRITVLPPWHRAGAELQQVCRW